MLSTVFCNFFNDFFISRSFYSFGFLKKISISFSLVNFSLISWIDFLYCFSNFFCISLIFLKISISNYLSGSFFPLWSVFLLCCFFPVLLHWLELSVMLNKGGESGYTCVVSDFLREAFRSNFRMLNQPCILEIITTLSWFILFIHC